MDNTDNAVESEQNIKSSDNVTLLNNKEAEFSVPSSTDENIYYTLASLEADSLNRKVLRDKELYGDLDKADEKAKTLLEQDMVFDIPEIKPDEASLNISDTKKEDAFAQEQPANIESDKSKKSQNTDSPVKSENNQLGSAKTKPVEPSQPTIASKAKQEADEIRRNAQIQIEKMKSEVSQSVEPPPNIYDAPKPRQQSSQSTVNNKNKESKEEEGSTLKKFEVPQWAENISRKMPVQPEALNEDSLAVSREARDINLTQPDKSSSLEPEKKPGQSQAPVKLSETLQSKTGDQQPVLESSSTKNIKSDINKTEEITVTDGKDKIEKKQPKEEVKPEKPVLNVQDIQQASTPQQNTQSNNSVDSLKKFLNFLTPSQQTEAAEVLSENKPQQTQDNDMPQQQQPNIDNNIEQPTVVAGPEPENKPNILDEPFQNKRPIDNPQIAGQVMSIINSINNNTINPNLDLFNFKSYVNKGIKERGLLNQMPQVNNMENLLKQIPFLQPPLAGNNEPQQNRPQGQMPFLDFNSFVPKVEEKRQSTPITNNNDKLLTDMNINLNKISATIQQSQQNLINSLNNLSNIANQILKTIPSISISQDNSSVASGGNQKNSGRFSPTENLNLIGNYRDDLGLTPRNYTTNTIFPGNNSIV